MQYPTRKTDLAWRKVADEIVVIDLGMDRQFHQLNEVGALIWTMCDGTNDVSAIVQSVMNDFDTSLENAQKDVQEFIADLNKMSLLQ